VAGDKSVWWALAYALQSITWPPTSSPRSIRFARLALEQIALASHRRASPRYAAPTRCGALADERRIAAGDEGGGVYRRACASQVASLAAGVPLGALAGTGEAPALEHRRAHRHLP